MILPLRLSSIDTLMFTTEDAEATEKNSTHRRRTRRHTERRSSKIGTRLQSCPQGQEWTPVPTGNILGRRECSRQLMGHGRFPDMHASGALPLLCVLGVLCGENSLTPPVPAQSAKPTVP